MKEQRKFKTFAIMLNDDDSEVLRRLRCEYGINISGTIKLLLRQKLSQLDLLRDKEDK